MSGIYVRAMLAGNGYVFTRGVDVSENMKLTLIEVN